MENEAYKNMCLFENTYWWYSARQTLFSYLIKRFSKVHQASILDYGSGFGANAQAIARLGHIVVAADINDDALRGCKEKGVSILDLKVQQPDINTYDIILLADVLEHIGNDFDFLERARGWLKPNGLLIIAVPAYEFLWSGEDYVSQHYRRYTWKKLIDLMKKAKFKNKWSSYSNVLLFPIEVIYILCCRIFFPKSMYESNVNKLPEWINGLLKCIYNFEIRLMPFVRFPCGLTIVGVFVAEELGDGSLL